MIKHIYVAVDPSAHGTAAVDLAIELARAFSARLTACHVYAAPLHDLRFRQMEYTLPDRYREEAELERQRTIHGSLISKGLRLISEAYLDEAARKATDAGLSLERRVLGGKHSTVLVDDIRASDSELVVLGALGMGAVPDSTLGSVATRVVRHATRDTLVVRTVTEDTPEDAPILVGIDGSPQSWHALTVALALGRACRRPVHAVAAYDPYLHYGLFKSIVEVLPAEAASVFRFAEQERLHEEIIDSGLARIYQSHLDVARRVAQAGGMELSTELLAGKCFSVILQACRIRPPWLLVLGRTGFHADVADTDLGSNTENLLRLAPCNVLLTAGRMDPPIEIRAEETIAWTREAEARMERAPAMVRAMARAAVIRHATEQGHTVITCRVIDDVMERLMPAHAAGRTETVPDAGRTGMPSAAGAVAVCSACGSAARGAPPPVQCPICGAAADRFRVIDLDRVAAQAAIEGGAVQEETLPGMQVGWTAPARAELGTVPEGIARRQLEARVEKRARSLRLPAITREFVVAMRDGAVPAGPTSHGGSTLPWTADALRRLERVPAGFMREATKREVEHAARARGAERVDLACCEAVIGTLRALVCPAGGNGEAST